MDCQLLSRPSEPLARILLQIVQSTVDHRTDDRIKHQRAAKRSQLPDVELAGGRILAMTVRNKPNT